MINKYPISFVEAESVNIGPDLVLSGAIGQVVSHTGDGVVSADGTAFCLAMLENGEAIFATAYHVIRPLIDDPDIGAFILLRKGPENSEPEPPYASVPIRGIAAANTNSDVALLVVNVNGFGIDVTELKWLPLEFGEPQVGQYCVGLGFPQDRRGVINFDMLASRGVIEEIHPNRRDSSFTNFPSFRTNGLYKPAMSGGPIVDINGSVIGIIATGMETVEPELVTGYGSSIGAIAELRVPLHSQAGELQEFTVPQLVVKGVLRQADQSVVRLHRDENGVTLTWNPL